MSRKNKHKATHATNSSSERGGLPASLIRQQPPPDQGQTHPENQQKRFLYRLRNDIKKPRFWIEGIALLVVCLYTRQAVIANRLASQNFQISQRPQVSLGRKDGTIAEFAFSADQTHSAGLKLYLQNGGQSAALTPTISIIMSLIVNATGVPSESPGHTENFQWLYRSRNKNGQSGPSNGPSIPPQSEYVHYLPNLFSPDELQSLLQGNKAGILTGMLQYCDEFGNYTCRQFVLFWNGPPISQFAEITETDCTLLYSYPSTPPPDGGTYILPCEQPTERAQREKREREEFQKQAALASRPHSTMPAPTPTPTGRPPTDE